MADDKALNMDFNDAKQRLLEEKCNLDQNIRMLEEQAERIITREERILADARHKIEVVTLIQEKVDKNCKFEFIPHHRF